MSEPGEQVQNTRVEAVVGIVYDGQESPNSGIPCFQTAPQYDLVDNVECVDVENMMHGEHCCFLTGLNFRKKFLVQQLSRLQLNNLLHGYLPVKTKALEELNDQFPPFLSVTTVALKQTEGLPVQQVLEVVVRGKLITAGTHY